MTHPQNEEWMEYLYQEVSPERRRTLDDHLRTCRDCRVQLQQWRGTLSTLDQWSLTETPHRPSWRPNLAWAAAALLIASASFLAGRSTAPGTAELRGLRSTLEVEFRSQLNTARQEMAERLIATAVEQSTSQTQRLLEDFAQAQNEHRAEDLEAVGLALAQIDSRRRHDHETLRRALETVAVETEDSLVQLAGATLPARTR